jgi:hypothetical protein
MAAGNGYQWLSQCPAYDPAVPPVPALVWLSDGGRVEGASVAASHRALGCCVTGTAPGTFHEWSETGDRDRPKRIPTWLSPATMARALCVGTNTLPIRNAKADRPRAIDEPSE